MLAAFRWSGTSQESRRLSLAKTREALPPERAGIASRCPSCGFECPSRLQARDHCTQLVLRDGKRRAERVRKPKLVVPRVHFEPGAAELDCEITTTAIDGLVLDVPRPAQGPRLNLR